MAKKKQQGHYCKVCGEYKSNESFTGKGHKNHICKKCSKLSKEDKEKTMASNNCPTNGDVEEDSDVFKNIELPFDETDNDYQSSDVVYYDGYLGFVGIDKLLTSVSETKRYSKLKVEEKNIFRGIVQNLIIEFWELKRLIPDGGEVNQITNTAVSFFKEEMSFTVKNDKDLRRIVQSMVVPTINKRLRRERKNRL